MSGLGGERWWLTASFKLLIGLYHERWEHEIAYLALRHTLGEGRVLRSTDPAGLAQEMWALLTVYQALRRAMVTAVESQPGTDPDRASFATALHTARDLLTQADGIIDADTIDPVGEIGRAVLDALHPPRRSRTSVRKVKSPLSRYNKERPVPARTQHPDHQPRSHHQRTGCRRCDTRTGMLDNSPRTLTTRH